MKSAYGYLWFWTQRRKKRRLALSVKACCLAEDTRDHFALENTMQLLINTERDSLFKQNESLGQKKSSHELLKQVELGQS